MLASTISDFNLSSQMSSIFYCYLISRGTNSLVNRTRWDGICGSTDHPEFEAWFEVLKWFVFFCLFVYFFVSLLVGSGCDPFQSARSLAAIECLSATVFRINLLGRTAPR